MTDLTKERLEIAIKRVENMILKHPEAPKEFVEDLIILTSIAKEKLEDNTKS